VTRRAHTGKRSTSSRTLSHTRGGGPLPAVSAEPDGVARLIRLWDKREQTEEDECRTKKTNL
jgi:hypothetical protein